MLQEVFQQQSTFCPPIMNSCFLKFKMCVQFKGKTYKMALFSLPTQMVAFPFYLLT